MKKQKHITQFKLSENAKSGLFIVNMQTGDKHNEHDINKPHRDNHYQIMIATGGDFKLNIDFEELKFNKPTLLFVFPEQVHYIINTKNPKGWVISIDPLLIDSELQLLLEEKLSKSISLSEKAFFYTQLISLIDLIEKVQSNLSNNHTHKVSHSLLYALLNLIVGNSVTLGPLNKTIENRGIIIERKFYTLLKLHYKTWKQPAKYASKLSITVAHLNDTVKGITGNSVSANIQQRAILEAKRLLYFTDNSVKEIGYELGYNEPVYFGKLFKKLTGISPLQFRQLFRD